MTCHKYLSLAYGFADPIPEDLAHASAPIHLDDVVSAEVINTEMLTNGRTDKNDRNYSSRKGKTETEKHFNSRDSSDNKTTERQHNKDTTDVIPSAVGDNFIEESELEPDEHSSSTAYMEQLENGITGMFGNGELNHYLANGVISDSEMGTQETEVKSKESQIENEFDSVTQTIAKLETASLRQLEAVLNDKSETIRVDTYSSNLKQVSERNTEENESKDLVIDTYLGSIVLKNSNEITPEPNLAADDTVEHSESQISNMLNASAKQDNNNSTDLDFEKPNAVKANQGRFQSRNSKKRQQKEKKSASKYSVAQNVSQLLKDKAANQQSKLCTKAKRINIDYKAQFASYISPKIDIVSLFKQTIGHKPLKNPHTYESARAELETYKQDDSGVIEKHTFVQKIDRSSDHDTLVTAVHELQRMFDKAAIRPVSAQSEDNSIVTMTAGSVEEDLGDKDSAINIEQTDTNSGEAILEAEAVLHVNTTKDKSFVSNDKEETNNNATDISFTLGNAKESIKISQDSADKPKKVSRRGYTGKFAIAHLLHQDDFDTDKDKAEGNSEMAKQREGSVKINNSVEVTVNKEHEKVRIQRNSENSFGMLNGANEAVDSIGDKYMDLVLESQAVESLMKHKADNENEITEKKRPERKVSFSSDEIVTEDSENDSSSDEESDLVDDQDDMQRQKISAYENNTYTKSYPKQNPNMDRSRNISDYKFEGARKKKSRSQHAEFDNEKYGNFEAEDFYHDNKERYDPHVQYNPVFAGGYPYSFPQRSSTKHSLREHGIPPTPQSIPGYPHAVYPSHRQQFYPGNFYSQWYPPFSQPFHQYPMQYSPYFYPTPSYGPYPVPYASKGIPNEQGHTVSESEEEENMKEAFELQTDYIRLMCQKGDKGGKGKKKHKRMS